MSDSIITTQPTFLNAKTHSKFLKKNNISSCDDIKDMFHQCMNQLNQDFISCNYYYNMMFICTTLKYKEDS